MQSRTTVYSGSPISLSYRVSADAETFFCQKPLFLPTVIGRSPASLCEAGRPARNSIKAGNENRCSAALAALGLSPIYFVDHRCDGVAASHESGLHHWHFCDFAAGDRFAREKGFEFGFKVFGPVIPIAAFFYNGIATLTALGQIAAVWIGGGTLIPWALIPAAAICGVDPFELARHNLRLPFVEPVRIHPADSC